jgi:bchE/P-methylase family protein
LKRAIVQFKRSFDLGMFFIFLTQNFNLKNEVLEKYDLPYADNLDEMPK